ncbi:endocuticle structural glycoprotein SgAbd-2-like [Bacillus rossius redtenbacheri]|uniref:endocuticle structural glycoprotein SgAbd-2-like n=1 Tax=Bacillus rossius redtenbacheri TaxID=93214 RepID=UPI002FDCEA39
MLAVVAALPAYEEPPRRGVIPVLQRTEVRDEFGQFSLSYLTGDGTALTEQGALKPSQDGRDLVLVKQGSVSYTAPDGTPVSFRYVADERGFRPEGDHLPAQASTPSSSSSAA